MLKLKIFGPLFFQLCAVYEICTACNEVNANDIIIQPMAGNWKGAFRNAEQFINVLPMNHGMFFRHTTSRFLIQCVENVDYSYIHPNILYMEVQNKLFFTLKLRIFWSSFFYTKSKAFGNYCTQTL